MINEAELIVMKLKNKDLCLDICEMSQNISRTKQKLQNLEMFYKLKIKEQKALVREIFISEGSVEVLPTYRYKKQKLAQMETNFIKAPKETQEETLERLLAIRNKRQKKAAETPWG